MWFYIICLMKIVKKKNIYIYNGMNSIWMEVKNNVTTINNNNNKKKKS